MGYPADVEAVTIGPEGALAGMQAGITRREFTEAAVWFLAAQFRVDVDRVCDIPRETDPDTGLPVRFFKDVDDVYVNAAYYYGIISGRGNGRFDPSSLITREEAASSNNTVMIFLICFVLIYLILSALYESFFLPFAVLLAVPTGLLGSFLLAKAMGLENNIYLQTGLIMLIGLVSKTAILITEYAVTKRRQGSGLAQAAIFAARERFRPIMMTVLTMVIGLFPLLVASGVGAKGNSTIGAGVVGGMVLGTLALLFFTPALFIVFEALEERVAAVV